MDKAAVGSRYFLGAVFVVFGLNGFFNFIPMPPMPMKASAFMMALGGTGYFFPVLKITEIVCGLMLLANKYVALALVILAPIVLQIVLFHVFLAPGVQALVLPILMTVAGVLLAKSIKQKYAALLSAN